MQFARPNHDSFDPIRAMALLHLHRRTLLSNISTFSYLIFSFLIEKS